MKRSTLMKILTPVVCVTLLFAVLVAGCGQPAEEVCLEDQIAQVEGLITMTEETPLSEDAKSTIIAGWNEVISQLEERVNATAQVQAVIADAQGFYISEVCATCPLVCEEQCKHYYENDGFWGYAAYATCWYACLAGKAVAQVEAVEPMWPMPEGAATIELSQPMVEHPGEQISGEVIVADLGLLLDETLPYSDLGPLTITVTIETPEVAQFPDGGVSLEHEVDPTLIAPNGSYVFDFQLVGVSPGDIGIALSWKWTILTEGACSVAINGIYAGCYIGGQLNADCVCAVLADMPAPGSWACKVHPKVFRTVWSLWGCPGASPY